MVKWLATEQDDAGGAAVYVQDDARGLPYTCRTMPGGLPYTSLSPCQPYQPPHHMPPQLLLCSAYGSLAGMALPCALPLPAVPDLSPPCPAPCLALPFPALPSAGSTTGGIREGSAIVRGPKGHC